MENFVIHIFGYGETQLVAKDINFKTKTTDLSKVKAVIDAMYGMKPQDSQAEKDYRVITLFAYDEVRYGSKNGFIAKDLSKSKTKIDALVKELTDLHTAARAQPQQP